MLSECRLSLAPFLWPLLLLPSKQQSSGGRGAPADQQAARVAQAAQELAVGMWFPISTAAAAKLPSSGASPGCVGVLLPSPRVQFLHHEPGHECFASSQGRTASMELPSIARLLGWAANVVNACQETGPGKGERCSFSFPFLSMPIATKYFLSGEKEENEANLVGWRARVRCSARVPQLPGSCRKFIEIVIFSQNILQTKSV